MTGLRNTPPASHLTVIRPPSPGSFSAEKLPADLDAALFRFEMTTL
jgi:hypothetical protein